MATEADTRLKHAVPKLQAASSYNDPHSTAEQCTITDGRVVPVGTPNNYSRAYGVR
jgi:type I restriction enzyme R subunit